MLSEADTTTYQFSDFSDRYTAELETSSDEEVFRPGSIRVSDRQTGKRVIEVSSEELMLDLDDGKVRANVHELPYGEQSLIVAEDFNFDGLQDIAVMDGQNSCCHGPSYQVSVGTEDGLQLSEVVTTLAQENCGLFEVDTQTRTISTMTNSSCCWHQSPTWQIRDGEPLLSRKVVEDADGESPGLPEQAVWRDVDGKRAGTTQTRWSEYNVDVLLSFRLRASKNAVTLFVQKDRDTPRLFYAIRDAQNRVELLYPQGSGAGEGGETGSGFTLRAADQTPSFINGRTPHVISLQPRNGRPRIDVVQGRRMRSLAVDPTSIECSLDAIAARGPETVAGLADIDAVDAAP